MCRRYKFRGMRLTKSFVVIWMVWCEYLRLLSFFQLFILSLLYSFDMEFIRFRWKWRKLSLQLFFFFCSCISVCARYSALQIFHEETLGLFTSCFAFMIPSCVCLQMKSEKRKVKREVTGIFNEILSKPLFRYLV